MIRAAASTQPLGGILATMRLLLLFTLILSIACLTVAQSTDRATNERSEFESVTFCELRNLRIGMEKQIRIRTVYRVGFEWSELYSLKCIGAPSVWVEFSEDWEAHTRRAVRKTIQKAEGTYGVIFDGKLVGSGGFGHMGVYPMKLEVTRVESAKRLSRQSYHAGALTLEMRRRVEAFEGGP